MSIGDAARIGGLTLAIVVTLVVTPGLTALVVRADHAVTDMNAR